MKKTLQIMLAFLMIAALLFSFAACGGKKAATGADLMQGIFEKLVANKDYTDWKAMFSATTIEEAVDGTTITIKAAGEEGVDGAFVFTLDGDYIVNTAAEGDYSSYSFLMFLKNAVADYYGMNSLLMSGYLAGLGYFGKENTLFFTEKADGKTTYKMYAAGAWEMKGLDEMYVNEKALEYTDALTDDSTNSIINCGKIQVVAYGSKTDLELIVGEYGENTDLTLQSLQNTVAKLQPNGFEAFKTEVTALKETVGNGYTLTPGIPAQTAQNHDYKEVDGYSYVTAVFSADAAAPETDEPAEDGQNPVMNFIGDYSAERCTITIEADGETDAKIFVRWGNSASETVEYTMSGMFDPDTMRINYSDGVKKIVTYDENGDVAAETTEYENGFGRIQFYGDGTLAWQDEQEADRLVGMTFEWNN